MLQLKNINKIYKTNNIETQALKDVSISFRESEFVSILGKSGGGKTTLLNIIGGLDKYSSGDLIIEGKSTKEFTDRDWDYYRNVKVGFIFQSYNLIPHQSLIENVELALTLTGVAKAERKKRASQALDDVGLAEHKNKRPNELSGGQMQRVAIARALVNNPDIILADEPTGALDSNTSEEIMNILKEISKTKLVIMVTHDRDLAERYSTRIIRISDGAIISDSDSYQVDKGEKLFAPKKISMKLSQALGLSFNNLLTKKARTILTAFAGSIGIIGIALILSISAGASDFIVERQRETLKSYPIEIQKTTLSFDDLNTDIEYKSDEPYKGKIHADDFVLERRSDLSSSQYENNLASFKKYIIENQESLDESLGNNFVAMSYDTGFEVYTKDRDDVLINTDGSYFEDNSDNNINNLLGTRASNRNFTELMASDDGEIYPMVKEDYELIEGTWPKEPTDLLLVTDFSGRIMSQRLYEIGLLPSKDYKDFLNKISNKEEVEIPSKDLDPSEILGHTYKAVSPSDFYKKDGDKFINIEENEEEKTKIIEEGIDLKIVGIIKKKENTDTSLLNSPLAYSPDLTDLVINHASQSELVKAQRDNTDKNVLTNLPFNAKDDGEKVEHTKTYLQNLKDEEVLKVNSYLIRNKQDLIEDFKEESEKQRQALMADPRAMEKMENSEGEGEDQAIIDYVLEKNDKDLFLDIYDEFLAGLNLEKNLEAFGYVSKDNPSKISIYVENFENRDRVKDFISQYNDSQDSANKISYTDYIGLIASSITEIITVISYILIAFVGVSLIVSSIMIGIITYISVLERSKEIGILRAIGASKGDIRKVFLAETFIIGLLSGLIGVIATKLINIPLSNMVQNLGNINDFYATLPKEAAIILVIISIILSLIAGLIPANIASKKDAIKALSQE